MKDNLIRVTFWNGRYGYYTMAVFEMMVSDPDVAEIKDCETGKILHSKEEE